MSGEPLQRWAPRVAASLGDWDAACGRVRLRLGELGVRDARRRSGSRGALAASIRALVDRAGLSIVSDHPAAAPRETGARIRGTPLLAVPLTEEVRRTGGPRLDGRLFVLRLRDGRLTLARRQGDRLEVRWRLVDSVLPRRVPAILPAGAEVARRLPAELETELRGTLGVR